MAESEYDYPLAVPVFAHIAVVAIAGAAVAQRNGFVPPGWVLLCGLVAAVTPVAGDMIRPGVVLPRPFLAVVVIAGERYPVVTRGSFRDRRCTSGSARTGTAAGRTL
nr:hypothetical protein [Rhodococcus opacus]